MSGPHMLTRRLVLFASVVAAALAGQARIQAQTSAPTAADAEAPTAPVALDGVELLRVRGVSSYSAEARAAQIQGRVAALAPDPSVPSPSTPAEPHPTNDRIVAGDRLLMVVVDADAALEEVARGDLALAHSRRVRDAIDEYRTARTTSALIRAAALTVVATIALLAAVLVLAWLVRRFDARLRGRVQGHVRSVGIQSFEVVRADQIRKALESIFFGVRALVFLAVVLVFAGYVLALWPWTRALSRSIAGFALAPLRTLGAGFVANIPRFVFLAVLYIFVRFALRLIRLFFESVDAGAVRLPRFEREWALPTYNIIRVAVVAFGLIVAYPYIPGSQSEAFKGISLFIGVIFSLGSSSAISNVIAGYMLIYRRAFRVGDRVKIGDSIGEVIEMRVQVTHLRSLKNEEIIIPNSEILSGDVLNYSSLARDPGLILHTEVSINYSTPWRQVEALLLAAAGRTPGPGGQPAPYVLPKRPPR